MSIHVQMKVMGNDYRCGWITIEKLFLPPPSERTFLLNAGYVLVLLSSWNK